MRPDNITKTSDIKFSAIFDPVRPNVSKTSDIVFLAIFDLVRPDNVSKTSDIEFLAIFDLVRHDKVAKTCPDIDNVTKAGPYYYGIVFLSHFSVIY